MVTTKESLLHNLKAENAHDAWREFYQLYWGAIIRYARKLGLSEHQAEEVLQETMVALMRILPGFAYDRRRGKFRNFLLTIVHRKSLATLQRTARKAEVPWPDSWANDPADPFGNNGGAEAEAKARWRESLVEEAIRCLRDDPGLAENTFAIFDAYVVKQQSAQEVARNFGVTENAVYQIKNRLVRRIQAEVAGLVKSSGTQ